jgi:hypothetical protein
MSEISLEDVLARLGNPKAVTHAQIVSLVDGKCPYWLPEKSDRGFNSYLYFFDYVPCRNPRRKNGRWGGKDFQYVIYVRQELSHREQLAAARKLEQCLKYN